MLYLEYKPAPPLDAAVRSIWYSSALELDHGRERVLPTGCSQVILNLERDFLLDCAEHRPARRSPAAQVVGARSLYEIIDTSDLRCLIGIVFQPGGFPLFVRDRADLFTNRFADLEDIWGGAARGLRASLRALAVPRERIACLEAFLLERLKARPVDAGSTREAMVRFALERFDRAPDAARVSAVARATGWSERRFSEVFREQVGLTPKVWCRVQRFQRAVRRLHSGMDVRWAELAQDCGFYDQSHFANEFRAFSGIDATTYVSGGRTMWANHVQVK
jgi:AraC-like DNA-binding protein